MFHRYYRTDAYIYTSSIHHHSRSIGTYRQPLLPVLASKLITMGYVLLYNPSRYIHTHTHTRMPLPMCLRCVYRVNCVHRTPFVNSMMMR